MQRPLVLTTSNKEGDRREGREAEAKVREARGKHVIPPVTSVGPLNSLIWSCAAWRIGNGPITVVHCREDWIAKGLWSNWTGTG